MKPPAAAAARQAGAASPKVSGAASPKASGAASPKASGASPVKAAGAASPKASGTPPAGVAGAVSPKSADAASPRKAAPPAGVAPLLSPERAAAGSKRLRSASPSRVSGGKRSRSETAAGSQGAAPARAAPSPKKGQSRPSLPGSPRAPGSPRPRLTEEVRLRTWYGSRAFRIEDVEADGDCLYKCIGLARSQNAAERDAEHLAKFSLGRRKAVADSLTELDFVIAYDPAERQTKVTGKFKDLKGLKECISKPGKQGGRWADALEIVRMAELEKITIIITEMLGFGKSTLEVHSPTEATVTGRSKLTQHKCGARVLLYCLESDRPLGKWRTMRGEEHKHHCWVVPATKEGSVDTTHDHCFPDEWVGGRHRIRWEQVQHLAMPSLPRSAEESDPNCVLLLRSPGPHYKLILYRGKRMMRWSELPAGVRNLEFH